MRNASTIALVLVLSLAPATLHAGSTTTKEADALLPIAEGYVKLVLAVGQHDSDYVDAYYGPADWKATVERAGKRPLPELRAEAERLLAQLDGQAGKGGVRRDDGSRAAYLAGQLDSLKAFCNQLGGTRLGFDAEAEALYQVRPPRRGLDSFKPTLAALDALLTKDLAGEGPVHERYQRFRERFIIAKDRVDAVFRAAVAESRKRTLPHVDLPAGESFAIEYVTGKPWSGYNWYQGGGRSLIQVNTDLPIYIDRALDIAAHEGYPGHHAYNALLEQHLAKARGWVEFTVYPLYSPQSLIAEGTANLGIDIAFPGAERTRFEREVLFPLAGLDPGTAARYAEVRVAAKALGFAGNEVAREYLDGRLDRAGAIDQLVHYALMTPKAAEQRVRFFDKYRAYVINYNVGEQLAQDWVTRRAGQNPAKRWQAFVELLSSPRLPASLTK